MIETKPELRMGKNGRWTPATLRNHYRYRISHLDGTDRYAFAYAVLAAVCTDGGNSWTVAQRKAIVTGLELGMKEGIR